MVRITEDEAVADATDLIMQIMEEIKELKLNEQDSLDSLVDFNTIIKKASKIIEVMVNGKDKVIH